MAPSGTSALYRVVYRSAAVGVLSGADLDRILLRAKASNAGAGVTGLVLFYEGTFLQTIEGPPAGVLSLLERIRRDRRHSGVTVLESCLATTRMFPGWAMGYVAPRNLDSDQKAAFCDLMTAARRQSLTGPGETPLAEQARTFLAAFQDAQAA
jgi:hypothetical protein